MHIGALVLLYLQRFLAGLLAEGRVLVVRAPMFAISHARLSRPVHAYSPEHAQAITAQWRSEGLEGPDLHRFLGLGSLPPEILRALCVDRATRFARVASEEDLAAVHGALGLQPPASATRP